MKNLIFVLTIAIFMASNSKAQNIELKDKKGFGAKISFDPKYLENVRLSLLYDFGNVELVGSHEFYNKIDFVAWDIGLCYGKNMKVSKLKMEFCWGAHAGSINGHPGLGAYFEERICLGEHSALYISQKFSSNGSIGQYYENRCGIIIKF